MSSSKKAEHSRKILHSTKGSESETFHTSKLALCQRCFDLNSSTFRGERLFDGMSPHEAKHSVQRRAFDSAVVFFLFSLVNSVGLGFRDDGDQ